MRHIKLSATICLLLILSTNFFMAQEKTIAQAKEEMRAAMGKVHSIFKVMPDHIFVSAWEWFNDYNSPDAAIPPKYAELIQLGVASQIPCKFCVYVHTQNAKLHGATDAEINEAVENAGRTRYLSTIANGHDITFADFKDEWDNILAHMKKHSK